MEKFVFSSSSIRMPIFILLGLEWNNFATTASVEKWLAVDRFKSFFFATSTESSAACSSLQLSIKPTWHFWSKGSSPRISDTSVNSFTTSSVRSPSRGLTSLWWTTEMHSTEWQTGYSYETVQKSVSWSGNCPNLTSQLEELALHCRQLSTHFRLLQLATWIFSFW